MGIEDIETGSHATGTTIRRTALYYLRAGVYTLTALLGLSLLVIGTIAVIAEAKGTWHWMIHLESTVRYMAVFISWLLVALVPLTVSLLYGRWQWEDA
jgi:phosphoglycerol transferase MdoB-like AlkP superfamily enzyme